MFCHKCGNKLIEGSVFCQKCGTKIIADETSQQTTTSVSVNQIQSQALNIQTDKPTKKKTKKLPIIFGVVVLIIVVIIAANLGDKTDYVMTVKAHSPFVSQGYSYTYGTVLNDYIDSPIWEVSRANEKIYVNISGNTKDTRDSILVSIVVLVGENNQAVITPTSVAVGSDRVEGQDNVVRFLLDLFIAYDVGQSGTSPKPNNISYIIYTSKEHGFSFEYPSDWIDGGSMSTWNIITFYDGLGAKIAVNENYFLPFELDSDDEEIIKAAVNELHEFVSVADAAVNGHPMRELLYKSEGFIHGPTYVANYFYFVGDKGYQIVVEFPVDALDDYQSTFETLMNSYTIAGVSMDDSAKVTQGEVLYKGEPITNWMGARPRHLSAAFGTPTAEGQYQGGNYYGYDGIIFIFNPDLNEVVFIEVNTELITVNGVRLDKNRTGLINDFGIPSEEYWSEVTNDYIMIYSFDFYSLSFIMSSPEDKAYKMTVEQSNAYPNEFLLMGIPLDLLFDFSESDVVNSLGSPEQITEVRGTIEHRYHEFTLTFEGNEIRRLEITVPSVLSVDGVALDINQEGLYAVLGTPSYDDSSEYYIMVYEMADYSVQFTMSSPFEVSYLINIWRH